MIPTQFTCDGQGISPVLIWQQTPAGTRSIAIIVSDPDAPLGTFIHWVIYNLPPGTRGLPQGGKPLPAGAQQGENSNHDADYYPPCPPRGAPHRYLFNVYALNQMLELPLRSDENQVQKAMAGHILASGQLMARYGR